VPNDRFGEKAVVQIAPTSVAKMPMEDVIHAALPWLMVSEEEESLITNTGRTKKHEVHNERRTK